LRHNEVPLQCSLAQGQHAVNQRRKQVDHCSVLRFGVGESFSGRRFFIVLARTLVLRVLHNVLHD
jgi:hypothetical protein